jgi:predicted DNA-binding WGR domain protein
MPQTLRGKTVSLSPNLLFNGPKATARCRRAWKQLFDVLHEHGITAESVTEFQWRVCADKAQVQLTPVPTDNDLGSRLWTTLPVFEFGVDNFLQQVKGLKGPKNAPARAKLNRQFRDWIADAVAGSFESEPVQTKYSRFNQNGHPFSTSIELSADGRTDSPVVLWSSVRNFKRRPEKKPPREKRAQAKPDYSSGWRRYYFDDGKTRRFWYIQGQGATQTIVEGELGTDGKSTTKKLKSPQAAKEAVEKAVDEKVAKGNIAYAPEEIRYVKAHNRNIERIQLELVEYEQQQGYRLPHEYRRHVLACNGGGLNDYDKKIAAYVSMPGHPVWKKVEVYCILGFASHYDHESLIRTSARTVPPSGHFQFARSPVPFFTIDQQGTVYALNMDGINRDDYDDDGYLYLDRFPAWPVAHSLTSFSRELFGFQTIRIQPKKRRRRNKTTRKLLIGSSNPAGPPTHPRPAASFSTTAGTRNSGTLNSRVINSRRLTAGSEVRRPPLRLLFL